VKTANEAIAEILEDKHSNLFEIIHLIYSAALNTTEGINGIGSYQ
jgi:predicted transcriptional regulator